MFNSRMTWKRHSPEEIEAKLRQAAEMADGGKQQAEIADALGISVMTYHRWRKPNHGRVSVVERKALQRLELENSRLRRLAADLLLAKIELVESLALAGRHAA